MGKGEKGGVDNSVMNMKLPVRVLSPSARDKRVLGGLLLGDLFGRPLAFGNEIAPEVNANDEMLVVVRPPLADNFVGWGNADAFLRFLLAQ